MNCAAVTSPNTNPEQAAVMSKATAPVAPNWAWILQAVPNKSSGVEVARTIKSISAGVIPAIAIAFFAACKAIALKDSDGAASRRFPIPVRLLIHSSEVSTSWLKTWFSKTVSGVAEPLPVITTPDFCTMLLPNYQWKERSHKSERQESEEITVHPSSFILFLTPRSSLHYHLLLIFDQADFEI